MAGSEVSAYVCAYPALRVSEITCPPGASFVVVNRVPSALPAFSFSTSHVDDESQHALITCPTFPGISPVVSAFVEGA